MGKEIYNKDINITLANFSYINNRMGLLSEQKSAIAAELAFSICNADLNLVEILDSIKVYSEGLSFSDKVLLCSSVYGLLEKKNDINFKFVFQPSEAEPIPSLALNKIAYTKNKYTDRALTVFSSLIRTNKSVAVSNFTLACDEVVVGNCEFALLPLENTTGGILYSFYSLIENNELNIFATCEVTDIDDDFKTTRFALVCKNRTNIAKKKKHSRYFEFIYTISDNLSISNILSAAEQCGLKLIQHNSVPIVYKTEEYSSHFIFCADNSSLDVFLLFLSVFAGQYISLGIYTKIVTGKGFD